MKRKPAARAEAAWPQRPGRCYAAEARGQGAVGDTGRHALLAVSDSERAQSMRAFFEESPAGILRVELDDTIADANVRACEILGCDRREILGRSTRDITHPEDLNKGRDLVADVNSGRAERLKFAKRYLRKDGSAISVQLTSRPVRNADGSTAYRLTMIEDMTAQEVAESKRQAELQRFRLVVEAAPNAMIVSDGNGVIKLVNAQTEALFGYTREELLGQSVEMLLPVALRAGHARLRRMFAAMPKARAMGEGRELFALRKDGVEIPIEIGLNPIDTADGPQVLASIVDITERKRVETERARYTAELQRSNHDLDQFAYVASHDLKAPLRAIQNLASWIAKDTAGVVPEKSGRHLSLLISRARRMENLLDDLLIYSRAGRKLGDLDVIRIDELIAESVEILAPGPDFAVQINADIPAVRTYRAPLREIFLNLIGNAKKHHDRRAGEIRVTCARDGDAIACTISDDGPGIPCEYRETVFGMFQTLRARDEVEGSGMGLAFVKKLVESQGGSIAILDPAGSRGARVRFTWPVQAA